MNRYTKLIEPENLKKVRAKELALISDQYLSGFKFRAYKTKGFKERLQKENYNKCCYCGSLLKDSQAASHIEHYRQKKDNPKDIQLGSNGLGYYWLACDWNNLILSCGNCNISKKSQFPLINSRHRFLSFKNISIEKPLLLNFSEHDYISENNFKFENGDINGLTERAKETIIICNLFRDTLVIDRNRKICF